MTQILFPKVDLSGVKGVLVDIDNTLYPYQTAHLKALEAAHKDFCSEIINLSFEEFKKNYRSRRNQVVQRLTPQGACRSRLFAFHALLEELSIPHAFNKAFKYESLYWKTFLDCIKMDTRAFAFLESCQKKCIPVCAVSDMQTHIQVQKLQRLGVDQYIHFLVTSEEVGEEKPSRNMFETALSKLNLEPADVTMIGDCIKKDIAGAEALGIKAYQVETLS